MLDVIYLNSYNDLKKIKLSQNLKVKQGSKIPLEPIIENHSHNYIFVITKRFDRFLDFSNKLNYLTIESGVKIIDVLSWCQNNNFTLPNFNDTNISVGELIKSQTHDKNNFLSFVTNIEIYTKKGFKKISKSNKDFNSLVNQYFITKITIKLNQTNKIYGNNNEYKIPSDELNIIFGGSSGVGKELAYQSAKKGISSIIISSSKKDLLAIKNDIFLKYNVKIFALVIDLSKNNLSLKKFISLFKRLKKKQNHLFFPVGSISNDDTIGHSSLNYDYLFNVNFFSVVKVISNLENEKLIEQFESVNFFGSIASIRGRSNNVMYSSCKKSLISFYESFRHNYNINTNFFLLGYMDTRLTDGKKLLFKPSSAEKFAEKIINRNKKNFCFLYYPFYWKYISIIVKLIPWRIYKKINF